MEDRSLRKMQQFRTITEFLRPPRSLPVLVAHRRKFRRADPVENHGRNGALRPPPLRNSESAHAVYFGLRNFIPNIEAIIHICGAFRVGTGSCSGDAIYTLLLFELMAARIQRLGCVKARSLR
jgi:hypothetical protein